MFTQQILILKKMHQKLILFAMLLFNIFNIALAQKVDTQPLIITVNANNTAQVIQNIGASGCWYSESIGKYWPAEKKERIAELLFSRDLNKDGNPKGIGLSAWRFNIGGGTAEHGIAGGIKDPEHRVECFLDEKGNYDWSKQSGYQWFLKQAKKYDVEDLIAFVNTPPVQFTKNGLGYKTDKDYTSNLKLEKYNEYADFLTEVLRHFNKEGIQFNFISPVNEPQWDWTGKPGEAKQEGCPWTNEEIVKVIKALDSSLLAKNVQTKILSTEAGMLTFLYDNKTASSRQIQNLFADTSRLNIGDLKSVPRTIAAHSYFTDMGDKGLINTRQSLADTAKKYKVNFWQSEYSMLGDGYKEGFKEKRTQMDCALFLAKVIHTDLTVANATAWQLWNAYEPGSADFDTRYYLLALKPDAGFKNGSYAITKNLWGLGHFSLFIRPGMQRLNILRSDNMSDIEAAQKVMVSAFKNKEGRLVMVLINYAKEQQNVQLKLQNFNKINHLSSYVTTAESNKNMAATTFKNINSLINLPARSITSIVVN